MALNISQGSGATLATDQINGEHLQRISAVSIHPLPAGTNFIGLASVQGTVDLGATDNAVLDSIVTNTTNLQNAIVQDDAPFTPATGYLMMIGGEFDDAGTDSVDEGDAGNVRITANRSMHTTLRDAAGNERGANVDASNRLTVVADLNAGTNAIGKLAANSGVDIGDVDVTSLPALATGANFIGLVSVQGNVAVSNTVTADVTGQGDVPITLDGETVGLSAGGNYIGLATVVPAFISNYTSFATVISAAGSASLFTPPSGQRWILKDLLIGALGANEVKIMSGGTDITPPISLATTGGYVSNFGDNGLRATAVNNSFGVNLQSAATISIMANVRFE